MKYNSDQLLFASDFIDLFVISALHIAALYGQAHLIDVLIQHGAIVNASDYLGLTPLHLACQKGYQNIIVSHLC